MTTVTESTETKIRDWVHSNFPLARKRAIGVDDSLFESGVVDSLGTLDVVMYLESEFGIVVSDEDMVADHFESIQSIANYVAIQCSTGSRSTA